MNTVYTFCKTFKISIIFTFFYVGVNGIVLLVNGFKYPANPLFTFLTSWFNLSEDYNYSSFLDGFASNFIPLLIPLIVYEFYLMRQPIKEKLYFINADVAFTFGVISTYFISAFTWIVFHYPGSGSSILGFALSMLVIFYLSIDLSYNHRKNLEKMRLKKEIDIKREKFYNILIVIFPIVLYTIVASIYILNNRYWFLHVLGFMTFIILVIIFKLCSFLFIKLGYTNRRTY